MLELRGETLAESVVENGVARIVGEAHKNDRIRLGQCMSAARIVKQARDNKNRGKGYSSGRCCFPTEATRRNRNGERHGGNRRSAKSRSGSGRRDYLSGIRYALELLQV